MEIELYQVDAFTNELFSGNPAGVVLNADKLDDKTMQNIAREMNLSETAFIINRSSDNYDIEVRFFTPTQEVPICGHATISAIYVYAKENNLKDITIRQKTKVGIIPVEIKSDREYLKITMTQGLISFENIIEDKNKELLLQALGIDETNLVSGLPIQIVSTGFSKVMIPIKSKNILDNLNINNPILIELSKKINCNGFYVFTFDSGEEGILTSGRVFAPISGIPEDPVTGNANGPLGAYLTKYNIIQNKIDGYSFRIKQGEAIMRKGYMDIEVFSNLNGPKEVKISGTAKIVFKTSISI